MAAPWHVPVARRIAFTPKHDRKNNFLEDMMNVALFTWLHEGAGNRPILDFLSVMAAELTPYLVIVCMALYWFTTDRAGKRVLLEGAAVVLLGLLVNQLITLFFFHPRPFMMGLCKPLIPHAPETSFPSDHATLLFGAALALLFRPGWRGKGAFLLLVAMIGAWGRVYTGLHFPFDILSSLGLALSAVLIVVSIRWALTPLYDTVIRTVDHVTALITRKERLTS